MIAEPLRKAGYRPEGEVLCRFKLRCTFNLHWTFRETRRVPRCPQAKLCARGISS